MENKERINYLFKRYLDNRCTREEMDEWLDLVQGSRHDKEIRRCMDELWARAGGQAGKRGPVLRVFWFKRIAAVVALFVLIAGGYYSYRYIAGKTSGPRPILEIVSGTAERKQVLLPDGSTVWLNASSRIRYPEEFSGSRREVMLEGEAFFSVTPDPGRPFLVHSRQLTTQVLGTEFNVKAYEDEQKVNITVLKGKVQVGDAGISLGEITADQQIHYNLATGTAETLRVDARMLTAWKNGEMVFDNVTLGEAARTIRKWYGVDILFGNAGLKNCRFTARFREEDDLDQVLSVICGLNHAGYSVDNSRVTLTGKACK